MTLHFLKSATLPTRFCGRLRKAIARQGRTDDLKDAAASLLRRGQEGKDTKELHEGTWPAVDHQERNRLVDITRSLLRSRVYEVDVQPLDLCPGMTWCEGHFGFDFLVFVIKKVPGYIVGLFIWSD